MEVFLWTSCLSFPCASATCWKPTFGLSMIFPKEAVFLIPRSLPFWKKNARGSTARLYSTSAEALISGLKISLTTRCSSLKISSTTDDKKEGRTYKSPTLSPLFLTAFNEIIISLSFWVDKRFCSWGEKISSWSQALPYHGALLSRAI